MARKSEILLRATGLDYRSFSRGPLAFDYDAMMERVGYPLEEIRRIQCTAGVGRTPLLEMRRLTEAVRRISPEGKGARILVKDEACNPSGSFKDRRASVSAFHARKKGYKGIIAATSGNYGAAVASQAAMYGLRCIIVQEVFDSSGRGQPEILEKGRKCEALGAEVIQTTVGPELFYVLLSLLEETGFFNASLYTPFSITGIETLGVEIAEQVREVAGRDPDLVAVTHAGGGNITGTARGLRRAGCAPTEVLAVSVDLSGLHMASDRDFNRKSFTTGHTGFSMPFTSWPDRVDVPRNAARPLRYIDRFVTVTQGEVFFATEALAQAEGLERGPAGNTSLAAALALAREMDRDRIIVVSETEYTGAGKHPTAQLAFAEQAGVVVESGDPRDNAPGRRIVIPADLRRMSVSEVDLDRLRESYVRRAAQEAPGGLGDEEVEFLAAETRAPAERVRQWLSARSHS
ncbi:MAG: 2-amino-4-oxopentanoate thiolase subunit OrtB [Acidobacteriota bacterium]